jgi:CheY-like chemotaxis protein
MGPVAGMGPQHVPGGFNVSEAQSLLELADSHEGLKSALVAYDDESVQTLLTENLTNMGFKVSVALNIRDAAKQLKFASFQVVLIQENYYGANLKTNQLLKAIQGMEVRTRHKMFIGMIGPSFTSLDDLTAFGLSLDTVINTKDIEDIERLLISAIEHVNKFFQAYNELRAARGVE